MTMLDLDVEIKEGEIQSTLGIVKMPPGYALMLASRDPLIYYWKRYDGKESGPHFEKWEVYRQAKEDWAKEEVIKLKGEEMNQAKIDKLLRNQSPMAKKVYGCVPKQEQWTAVEILQDLKRLGSSAALSTVEGCLWTLSESGLIKVKGGRWKQMIPSRIIKKTATPTVSKAPEPSSVKTAPRGPLDILQEVSDQARSLLETAENAALEISEYIEGVEANAQKMKQLQQLLQSIGT